MGGAGSKILEKQESGKPVGAPDDWRLSLNVLRQIHKELEARCKNLESVGIFFGDSDIGILVKNQKLRKIELTIALVYAYLSDL